jgi:hypothetical protein
MNEHQEEQRKNLQTELHLQRAFIDSLIYNLSPAVSASPAATYRAWCGVAFWTDCAAQ